MSIFSAGPGRAHELCADCVKKVKYVGGMCLASFVLKSCLLFRTVVHVWFAGIVLNWHDARSFLGREEVRHKSHVRHQYLSLCIAEMDARTQEKMLLKSGHASGEASRVAAITDQVRSLQMEISFRDILSWRTLARHRIAERDFHKDDMGRLFRLV